MGTHARLILRRPAGAKPRSRQQVPRSRGGRGAVWRRQPPLIQARDASSEVHAALYRGLGLTTCPSECADKRGHTMFTAAETFASDSGSLNAYFERSDDLLHATADVLDVRCVFPHVSEIAKRVLPHDALTMASRTTT
jgi:hypothetical protein